MDKEDLFEGLEVEVIIRLGRTKMLIADMLKWGQGSIIELDKTAGKPLDLYVNGKLIARGKAVQVGRHYGIEITEIVSQEERDNDFDY